MENPHLFEFDLDRGIQEQVIEKLEASPRLALSEGVGPPAGGIYALYYQDRLVYVGRVKGNLRGRLSTHRRKIEGRQNITVDDMQCRYLTFSGEWWTYAAELAVIAHYTPEWNDTGFGSNVPGRGRPGTKVSLWDSQFPPKSS